MHIYKDEIILIDGIPCIVLENNTLSPSRPRDEIDFTQLQHEKEKMFMKEVLKEIREYGWIFY